MYISFILVSPARAANIGAAARAIKTQGFNDLVVVHSLAHREDEAGWVACGAVDILENIREAPSLASIADEFDLLIATTARERGNLREYLTPQKMVNALSQQQQSLTNVGIVFGCEASGLSNSDLELCDLLSYIPLAQEYPSLNLAQAVMVYAYELGQAFLTSKITPGIHQHDAEQPQLSALVEKSARLFAQLQIEEDTKLKRWLEETLCQFGDRDIKMAHQLFSDILKKLT
ncbi:tRNA/rRNA methyltransferase [Shewanella yunxiaonensis]|uniref:tRNA (cytidine/uridine-2'-O-)-methyltransferase TrmJ n=1 Tax=Shewanella yunxiaonensis TaxID=2829809 RepID=A0ABX7YXN0_9GAMM|nr:MULTISPECIES: tRNA/rRNA methyltransferase [Shewanella]MDF0534361.1 tRNA/rRNA methyltransferase [Shewanella sp. A32]QUN07447.1 tRNA/rRNA methyltransferase [Shewanella yunxiaonensis]